MAQILTINLNPDTFISDLPDGVVGDVGAVDLITPERVETITVENYGEYEENIDGKFTVILNNGDTIRVDGYNGFWDIVRFHRLTDKQRVKLINNFRVWVQDELKWMERLS